MNLREMIAEGGGLVTLSDMAEIWGVSGQRVKQLAGHATFPRPLDTVGKTNQRIYLKAEVDSWRRDRMEMFGPRAETP